MIASDERDDAIEVAIETTVPVACCPGCGHAEIVPKERKPLWVRDIPLRPGKQTWLIWWKRRFACLRCMRTFIGSYNAGVGGSKPSPPTH
ncbi:MAG TPA: transposase family protein [Actinomycetota bacterium]|nr:transposase family protein [Actinomycetota bacterium]